MKNVEEAARLVAEKHQMIEDAKAGMQNLLDEIIDKFAPVKRGEIVKVTGASFKGRRMKVHTVAALYSSFSGKVNGFIAKGHVLRADGSPSFSQSGINEYPFENPF